MRGFDLLTFAFFSRRFLHDAANRLNDCCRLDATG